MSERAAAAAVIQTENFASSPHSLYVHENKKKEPSAVGMISLSLLQLHFFAFSAFA
jgi:hypothetical protein